ncbi:MAG: UDP-N-acetylglucosamine diphosphorylase/glucosamine-phosphate N-acetyltransferase [Rickettsiales bacterium]|jgi:bifunctional UDP-N-acetylglucosamine pyrophosphorylase/glucosamine-1-phosphate N-acetyltransferase|nr:UDP-N-acetylglucosamine diphosphorylase/glucosamine-phosphate N-acetyltransferase [Rickettsiales bacterium]
MSTRSTTPLAVVILAAGEGTRMKSRLPKVMHKLAHFPMIQYVTETAVQLKPQYIVTVTGPGMEIVQQSVREIVPSKIKTSFVTQQERLGTAHAVKQALPELEGFEGNIIILYGDTPLLTEATLSGTIARLHNGDVNGVVVLGFRAEDPTGYGRLLANDDGELLSIVECKDATPDQRLIDLCNSGVMAMPIALLRKLLHRVTNSNAKGEYYLTDLVMLAGNSGLYSSYTEVENSDEVMGINNRVQLAEAEYALQSMLRDIAMKQGATLVDPDTVYFAADTQLGKDVIIYPHVVFGPNTVVEDNVEIKSFSHVEGAYISKNATVGPFARLRPGARIGEEAHIGNFVEIKNVDVKQGAKINHLSYIGDATVGENSNIGAGTITCNYDGFMKHHTEIGRECLIGSNTILVAPVKIGNGVITGAGSVITQSVEDDALAISRSQQQNLAGKGKAIKLRKQHRRSQIA